MAAFFLASLGSLAGAASTACAAAFLLAFFACFLAGCFLAGSLFGSLAPLFAASIAATWAARLLAGAGLAARFLLVPAGVDAGAGALALAAFLLVPTGLGPGAAVVVAVEDFLLRPIAVEFAATRIFYAMASPACKAAASVTMRAMASRTIVDSVPRVAGPPPHVEALEEQLDVLRDRFPGAILQRYLDKIPRVGSFVHVAPGAVLVGNVDLRDDVSIWYGCVLRGDVNRIEIHERSNIQDGTVIHLGDRDPTIVGEEVVVGHRAVLHGCVIEGGCLIGIQSSVLDGAVVGRGSVVGSGALVTPGTKIPPHSLVLGVPGKVVKTLTAADEEFHRRLAGKYIRLAHNHREG